MTDPERESDSKHGLARRTILKGTAVAGLAGAGMAGTASADDWKELRFRAAGEATFSYRVSVSGKLKRAPNNDGYDELVDENTGKGAASKGRYDDWLFTGEITKLKLDGPGKVLVDGKVVEDTTDDHDDKDHDDKDHDDKDHDDKDDDHDDDDEELRNKITVEGQGETVEYKFRVSGRVEKGDLANEADEISDSDTVRGVVGSDGTDTYWYSGAIVFHEADGPLTVTLDINAD